MNHDAKIIAHESWYKNNIWTIIQKNVSWYMNHNTYTTHSYALSMDCCKRDSCCTIWPKPKAQNKLSCQNENSWAGLDQPFICPHPCKLCKQKPKFVGIGAECGGPRQKFTGRCRYYGSRYTQKTNNEQSQKGDTTFFLQKKVFFFG